MILCVDSSGLRVHLSLVDDTGRSLALVEAPSRDEGARDLLALYRLLLEQSGLEARPQRILAGRGPGSFIGTRVGLSFANGMAAAAALPVAGFDSLRALRISAGDPLAIAIRDARRGQYYINDVEGSRLLEDEAALLEAVNSASHIVSDALPAGLHSDRSLARLQDLLAQCPGRLSWLERAEGSAMLAAAQAAEPGYIEPVYLRGFL